MKPVFTISGYLSSGSASAGQTQVWRPATLGCRGETHAGNGLVVSMAGDHRHDPPHGLVGVALQHGPCGPGFAFGCLRDVAVRSFSIGIVF
jgi:hypothetical protein